MRGIAILGAACVGHGCGNSSSGHLAPRELSQPVVYGEDDRIEWADVTDSDLRAALGADVALVFTHRVALHDEVAPRTVESLGDAFGVCDSEPFADQPSWSFCSGVLIDRDLVLTAAHCLDGDPERAKEACAVTAFVTNYVLADEGDASFPTGDNLYTCRQLAAHSTRAELGSPDFAIVQLDRPVSRTPVALAPQFVRVGDEITVAGHGSGLPLKVEEGIEVAFVEDDGQSFKAGSDAFAGASGGLALNADRQLVGFQVAGSIDWAYDVDQACTIANVEEEPGEIYQSTESALAALCEAGWPTPLCGIEPSCGDGVCSDGEAAACEADCPEPECGDDFCTLEERSTCRDDCDRYPDVPPFWDQRPDLYLAELTPPGSEPEPSKPDAGIGLHLQEASIRPSCAFSSRSMPPVHHRDLEWLVLLVLTTLTTQRRSKLNVASMYPTRVPSCIKSLRDSPRAAASSADRKTQGYAVEHRG